MLTTTLSAFEETLSMVLISGIITVLIGLPLGLILYCSNNKQFFPNKIIYYSLQIPVKILNLMPYLLITVFSMQIIKVFFSNSTTAIAILPLTIATIPYFSILTFEAIKQLPIELTNTITSLGATPWQAITKFYLPEMLPTLILAFAKILVQLISCSTIAGLFGAGGIGALIMQKGYYSFEPSYLTTCIIMLLTTVQIIQYSSQLLAKQIAKS